MVRDGPPPRALLAMLLMAVAMFATPVASATDAAQAPAGPAAIPAAASVGWTTFGPPATYWGLGFAKNGDVIAVGLDQAPSAGLVKMFIARYTQAGALVSRVAMDRRYPAAPTGAFVVDPSDDSVLLQQSPDRTGVATLRRVDSHTGKLLRTMKLPAGIFKVAVDRAGRMFGVGRYLLTAGHASLWEFIVRLRHDGTLVTMWDERLLPPSAGPGGKRIVQETKQIGFGRDGRLVVMDQPDALDTSRANTPLPSLPAVTSMTTGMRDARRWSVPLEYRRGTVAAITWAAAITGITADAKGNVFLGEYIPKPDATGPVGYRLRMFGMSGRLMASWGYHGDHAGLHWPFAPQVDASGRLWVLDLDPAARTTRIRVLAAPPGG